MALQGIKIHQDQPSEPYKCGMCQDVSRRNKFLWRSYLTGNELFICRECAYKETYGTKGMKQAKKERLLEQKK